jgi:hypothetical protein
MRKGSLLANRDILVALHLSAFGADILDRKADIELVPITVFIGGNYQPKPTSVPARVAPVLMSGNDRKCRNFLNFVTYFTPRF